jgi:hypothetical protein
MKKNLKSPLSVCGSAAEPGQDPVFVSLHLYYFPHGKLTNRRRMGFEDCRRQNSEKFPKTPFLYYGCTVALQNSLFLSVG